jgi:adenylate cyclase
LPLQLLTIALLFLGVFLLADYFFEQLHSVIPAPHYLLAIALFAGYTILFRFLKERKQNDYIKNLFSKYVDKDVLRELLATGAELRLGGEKREVTVLFSDLRGFTTLSESMSPEELTSTLNAYLSAMSPVILKEKGTIDKYIGDAIMAFWNAPLFTPQHQLHAVRSALIMQDDLVAFNQKNNTSLAMGVGIHTGEVVVGNVGSMERINYTILGDVVNNTSRLEGLTKKYGVGLIVTEEVKNKISDGDIGYRKLDIITVKGKHLPTIIYEAFWTKDRDSTVMENYQIAFEEYEKGDFMNAKRHFKFLADEGDEPSKKMFERLEKLGDQKPEHWDGIWRFDEK